MPKRDSVWKMSLTMGRWDTSAAKLAWVNGWRKLPHIDREVQRLYDYPQQFAEDIYDRIERELRRSVAGMKNRASVYVRTALRLIRGRRRFRNCRPGTSPLRTAVVAAHKAEPYDGRNCCASDGKGISLSVTKRRVDGLHSRRTCSTEVLGAGRDARIAGLPLDAAQVLRLMCTDLAIPENVADQANVLPSIEEA